jgi:hypothetical protein
MLLHRILGCPPDSLRTGAGSFKRLLGGGENPTSDSGREFDNGKEAGRIEIILTGLIDHAKLTKPLGVPIGNNLIQLPALERGLVAAIPQTENELPRTCRHINQDNA